RVRVEDAQGMPPSIPFWLGEAPGRTDELSIGVSRLRAEIAARMACARVVAVPVAADPPPADGADGVPAVDDTGEPAVRFSVEGAEDALAWLCDEAGLATAAARQLVDYLGASALALGGAMPTRQRIVLERFFDETGDMHLVIHSPHGSRLNRAWGLALRKRFCRRFNFELQAAALEDSIVISLGTVHSFVLEDVARYLSSKTVRDVLTQAVLDAPIFGTYWRWNASIALAIRRFRNGKKVPAQFQRTDAEDLLATVFPDQLACAENLPGGDRAIP